jgi:EamA domain-containing membrane protein RarD
MTDEEDPPPPRRPGNGLMIGGGVVAVVAVVIFFTGMSNIQSGECIESCATTQYVVPIVLIAVAVTLFVIGWRRMRP